MTPISERQRANLYIYKNQKQIRNIYIYTKRRTLCKRQDQLSYVFIHKNPDTLRYVMFMVYTQSGFIYIQKA